MFQFLSDIIKTITSVERIKNLVRIPLYSNAIFLVVANVLNAVVGFFFWIIAARFYSADDVGLASAMIASMGLVVSISRLGLDMGLIRFLHNAGKEANSTLNTVFTIGILSSLIVSLIYISGLNLWSPVLVFLRENPWYFVAFVIFTVVSTLSVFMENAFVARRRTGFATARSLIFNLLRLLLPIVLASIMKSFGIFSSWGISMTVALFFCFFLFLPRVQTGYRFYLSIKKKVVGEIIHFSFANYLSNFFWGAPALIFPIMVTNVLGAESNAYFYVGWAIGNVLVMIPTAVSTSLFAEGSYNELQLRSFIIRSLKMVFIILVPVVILVLLIADKLLWFFGGYYSQNATFLLRILSLATLPLAINVIYLGFKRVQKDLKTIIGLAAFMAVITLSLAYFLLDYMGINGAAISWLAGQGITTILIAGNLIKNQSQKGRTKQ